MPLRSRIILWSEVATTMPRENEEKRKQRVKKRSEQRPKEGRREEQRRRFKKKKREKKGEWCFRDWSFRGRRDDFRVIILSLSVFREGYLLRAHKPTEMLEKRPASTRLRSKEVVRSEGCRCCYYCWLLETRLRPNGAMLPKGSINWEKTRWFCSQHLSARASEDKLK